MEANSKAYYVHPSSYVDEPCQIGAGTKIWHFSHVSKDAVIGERCNFGQNVFIASGVRVGSNCKVQNNVSLYTGVELEDDVFCGPSSVFTNVTNPRSEIVRHAQYARTLVRRGTSIGANATIVCGSTLGRYVFVAAGAVVKGNIPDYALMMGVIAKQKGWMSRHGHQLKERNGEGQLVCPESRWRYEERNGILRCLDRDEEQAL